MVQTYLPRECEFDWATLEAYDKLPKGEKDQFLRGCLADREDGHDGYDGTKLGQISSPIIEEFLKEEDSSRSDGE